MGLKQGVKAAWDGALSPLFGEFSGEVLVEVLDRSTPAVDPLYDEPVASKEYLEPVALKARVKLEKERLARPGGEEIDVDGRLTLRAEDLATAEIELDFSVRITVKGTRYAVAHIETAGQLGEEHLLTKVWLKEL